VRRGIRQRLALEHHGGTMDLGVLDFRVRRTLGHDDDGRDAQARGVIGDGLSMIAGAHGNHTAPALGVGQGRELVERAALLERSGELQVLELEVELAAGDARQRLARQERGALNRAFDARRRGADGLQRDHP